MEVIQTELAAKNHKQLTVYQVLDYFYQTKSWSDLPVNMSELKRLDNLLINWQEINWQLFWESLFKQKYQTVTGSSNTNVIFDFLLEYLDQYWTNKTN